MTNKLVQQQGGDGDGRFPGIDDVIKAAGWTPLLAEAHRALDMGPSMAAIRHDAVADAHWRYLASFGERSKAIAATLGIDVDQQFTLGDQTFSWDFAIEDHRVIEARYQASVATLSTQGLFLPISYRPMALGAVGFGMPGWLVKLLSLFGVEAEDLQAVGETLTEELGDDLLDELKELFSEAFEDVAEGKLGDAERKLSDAVKRLQSALERLAENLDDFLGRLLQRLARRLGQSGAYRKAAEIGGRIASKAVPGLGWLIFALELLWMLLRNIGGFYV